MGEIIGENFPICHYNMHDVNDFWYWGWVYRYTYLWYLAELYLQKYHRYCNRFQSQRVNKTADTFIVFPISTHFITVFA